MNEVKVMVVDDQHLVREGIASLLSLQDAIQVVGTAENGRDCLNKVDQFKPDLILMDINMPVMDGITATHLLREKGPGYKVLMLTTFDDEEYVVKSLKAGALGYLMKDIPIEDLAKAILMAMKGMYQMDKEIMGGIIGRLDQYSSSDAKADEQSQLLWNNLNEKEQEILKYLARGDTNKEIADCVHLSEGTVKNYISNILTTLGLRDRTNAAIMAHKNGWIFKD
ncbi:response regulator transcription factor [Spirochaeta cellobiosiphila]|uniref:response regulator transcription factor n=1 Tax=Spirochaeta cellobiosiphila TaxID=504483 RepID=UPI00042886BA|nr:response regulator transcription factor [Spirochaeta cellobiosiphila]